MSLYYNLNLNIEFAYDTPKDITDLFEKKMSGDNWSRFDKEVIPFDNEIEYLFDPNKSLTHQCLQTFHFQKQDYLGFPNYRKFEQSFYCFHLGKTIKDDGFNHGGYELIAWLAQFSRTNGYIGEYHEPESRQVNLLFCEYGIVTVKKVGTDKMFKMTVSDFKMKPIDQEKVKIYDQVKRAISENNYGSAKQKITELLEKDPGNEDFMGVREYIMGKYKDRKS